MKNIKILVLILFSSILFAQKKDNLLFEKSIYSVKIGLENGKNYLELNKENQIEIKTKNVESVNLSASGPNLKIVKGDNEKKISYWIIKPTQENLKDGFYSLFISFRGKKGRLYTHQFIIPVK